MHETVKEVSSVFSLAPFICPFLNETDSRAFHVLFLASFHSSCRLWKISVRLSLTVHHIAYVGHEYCVILSEQQIATEVEMRRQRSVWAKV
jgi:hypothetical protein